MGRCRWIQPDVLHVVLEQQHNQADDWRSVCSILLFFLDETAVEQFLLFHFLHLPVNRGQSAKGSQEDILQTVNTMVQKMISFVNRERKIPMIFKCSFYCMLSY